MKDLTPEQRDKLVDLIQRDYYAKNWCSGSIRPEAIVSLIAPTVAGMVAEACVRAEAIPESEVSDLALYAYERGATRALREAATEIRSSKAARTIADWLDERADRIADACAAHVRDLTRRCPACERSHR